MDTKEILKGPTFEQFKASVLKKAKKRGIKVVLMVSCDCGIDVEQDYKGARNVAKTGQQDDEAKQ